MKESFREKCERIKEEHEPRRCYPKAIGIVENQLSQTFDKTQN